MSFHKLVPVDVHVIQQNASSFIMIVLTIDTMGHHIAVINNRHKKLTSHLNILIKFECGGRQVVSIVMIPGGKIPPWTSWPGNSMSLKTFEALCDHMYKLHVLQC